MGINDPVFVDEKVEHPGAEALSQQPTGVRHRSWGLYVGLLLIAASVYLVGIISPPSLADDVDAVQAQIARTMLTTGDWVTARLDGVAYLEKPPLIYWMMAVFLQSVWRPRLGGAHSDRPVLHCSCAADSRIRHLGLRQESRLLCRTVHGHLRRPVSVYPRPDSRRHSHLHHYAGDVGAAARHRR